MFIKLFHLRKCGSEPVMWFFPLFTLWWLLRRKSTNYKHQKHCQPARALQGMKSFNIEKKKKKLPSNPPIKTANAFKRYNKLRVIVTDSSVQLCIAIEWNPHTAETIKIFDWMHGASRAETAGQLQQQAAAFHCRARPLSWSLAGSDLESNADQTTDWVTNAGRLACSLAQDADGASGRVPSLGPSVKCRTSRARALSHNTWATSLGGHAAISSTCVRLCAFVCARARLYAHT